jgi:hypothetical protein
MKICTNCQEVYYNPGIATKCPDDEVREFCSQQCSARWLESYVDAG